MYSIDNGNQEHQVFINSTKSTIDWWKGLNHNWKKSLLANLDFSRKFGADYYGIYSIISQKRIYNAYHFIFNQRIRERLDEFIVTEEALNEILNLRCLILESGGLKNAYPLNRFQNIGVLCVHEFCHIELFMLITEMRKLKVLKLGLMSSLKGISNCTLLEKIWYSRRNFTLWESELRLCKNLVYQKAADERGYYGGVLGPDFFNID
jgi:hypothetical protein